ncbi:chitosanase [Leptobacterium flavescens]|nr:chitosanase [Leptobacterium flavescens]
MKSKIIRIINVFETGTPDGEYDSIAVYKDGPVIKGEKIYQITYGRSQTTEFGNLRRLIELYIERNGIYADEFKTYVKRIGKTPSLRHDPDFKELLKRAARHDDIMRTTQDEFFDIYYFQPAYIWFNGHEFETSLSLLVIYDSFIHSGGILDFLRKRFPERPPVNGGDEKKWISQYVQTRHDWLRTHRIKALQKTIYRTRTFLEQIENNNWDLSQTVNTNGVAVP